MSYATTNPATGERIAQFAFISDSALRDKVEIAQNCFTTDWRTRAISSRASVVRSAARIMRNQRHQLASLATLEMGKLKTEAIGEVLLSADILDYYADNAEIFLASYVVDRVSEARIETCPLGLILAIEPWNFPFYQVARVAGPQLMAGNVLFVKHASNVPQCANAIARIFDEAGAPIGAYTNIFASVDQVADLIEDPRIRGVTLTGSESAGAAVAERAGRALIKSVLELGGSDPLVVLEDAPMGATLDNAVWGRMNTTGQSCTASKRMIVVGRQRGAQFLTALKERFAELRPGDPADPDTKLAPLASEKVLTDLLQQIGVGIACGATIAAGGRRIDRPGYYFEPTILTDIDPTNPIFIQELFGPVLSYYVVDGDEEAIELANATPFGLGASIFTADLDRGAALARRLESGMVFINRAVWSEPALPFGGVRNSGYGRELSELGIGEFVNRKLVHLSPPGSPPPSQAA